MVHAALARDADRIVCLPGYQLETCPPGVALTACTGEPLCGPPDSPSGTPAVRPMQCGLPTWTTETQIAHLDRMAGR